MNHQPTARSPELRGLYPIVDLDQLSRLGVDPVLFSEALLQARPAIVQVRAKATPPRDTLQVLRAVLPRCRAAGAWLFVNDRPDLALLADCDGVHVGQEDLPLHEVRCFAPKLRVGVSTHNLQQLSEALSLRPDYVALGPIFTTVSKLNPDPVVGVATLSEAHRAARAQGIPLVAIGGLTLARTLEISECTDMVAVISALLEGESTPDGGSRVAAEFQALFARERGSNWVG